MAKAKHVHVSAARLAAHRALMDASSRHVFVDQALHDVFQSMRIDRADRALATLLVQETVRRRAALDYRLSRLLDDGITSLPPAVQEALRIGLVQLLHVDRVPDHAAVDESVGLTKKAGFERFAPVVNAVLRRVARGEAPPLPEGSGDAALATRYSFPRWLVRRWRRLGPDMKRALEGSNRTPPLTLRVNLLRTDVPAVLRAIRAAGAEGQPGRFVPETIRVSGRIDVSAFSPLAAGEVSVQDESEALVSRLVDPLPGQRFLDLCAAPGGKAAHLWERSRGLATIVANESSRPRIARLADTMRRLGMPPRITVGDGTHPPFRGWFDGVLVDAPCTGTGVLARRAEARWRLERDDPARHGVRQRELLASAAELVIPGGVLVYAVCSIEPEETTDVLSAFLDAHPSFRLEPATLPAGAADEAGRLFLLPGTEDADGVFGARLRRIH